MFNKGILTTAAIALMMSSAAVAQTSPDTQAEAMPDGGLVSAEKADLTELTCWDAVTLEEDDRASALVLLYGYALGMQKQSVVAPQDIQVAIVNTMMACVDAPDDKALEVLQSKMARLAPEE